jgi:hypothetical protein
VEEDRSVMTSRRRFLGTAAGATGVALGAAVWGANQAAAAVVPQGAAQPLMADIKRSFVASRFAIELDGVQGGFLKRVEGGHAYAEVVNETVTPTAFTMKHLGNVKYEDFTMQLGFSMSKAVYDWISASWQMNYRRKTGAIVAADFNYDVRRRREFSDALITETTIPACDGSSKDPAYMTLKFSPESTLVVPATGKVAAPQPGTQQKTWLPSNFRLDIKGLDCTRVNKIEAFTVKQGIVTDDVGESRDTTREPGKLEFPNLVISLAQTGGQSWLDWFEDFVIRGNNGQENEKNGSLVFLSPNLQTELARVDFFNLGIFKITDGPQEAGSDSIARHTASLYVERMALTVNTAAP